MKTKAYNLTLEEVFEARDACGEAYHLLKESIKKDKGTSSPRKLRRLQVLEALKEQFTKDARCWKE